MRLDLQRIEQEITPLLSAHGVELVALDWSQGAGRGVLRVYIDQPGGDPRKASPELSVSLDAVTQATRDISTALDAFEELIEVPYTLEVGSPGPERPVQKRADFDRFQGLELRMEARGKEREKFQYRGTLRGTADADNPAGFVVRVEVAGKVLNVPGDRIVRARLKEVRPEQTNREGRPANSRRQQRLAAREQARAINNAHLAGRVPEESQANDSSPASVEPGSRADAPRKSER